MVDSAVYLGAEQADAEVQMLKALQVELKLAEMSISKEERRNETALNNHVRSIHGKSILFYCVFTIET